MKRFFMPTFLLLFCLVVSLTAQPPHSKGGAGDKGEKIKAFRLAFFTEKLALTPEESKAFWPIYDEFSKKQKELHKGMRDLVRPDKMDVLSDSELEAVLNKRLQFLEEEVKLEREYIPKLKSVISIRKVVKLHIVERAFRDELLKIMQNRREGRGGNPGAPPPHPNGPPPNEPQHGG